MTKRNAEEVKYKAPNGLSPAERAAYERAASKPRGGFWPSKDPQVGDSYVGNFVAQEEVESSFKAKKGEPQKMQTKYTFKNEDVTTSIWGSAVMDSELQSLNLKPGMRILILYQGRAESAKKGQQPAKLFSAVKVDSSRKPR